MDSLARKVTGDLDEEDFLRVSWLSGTATSVAKCMLPIEEPKKYKIISLPFCRNSLLRCRRLLAASIAEGSYHECDRWGEFLSLIIVLFSVPVID